jgi:hypothetical protein
VKTSATSFFKQALRDREQIEANRKFENEEQEKENMLY